MRKLQKTFLQATNNAMFTGIIQITEKAISIEKHEQSMEITFPKPSSWEITEGESISIDGICSTVKQLNQKTFSVYYMDETLKKTALTSFDKEHIFNLERSLTLQTFISGHLVSGHIDTTATVRKIEEVEDSKVLTFSIEKKFTKYIIFKGSITINGVSLTVIAVDDKSFAVSLIPHTLTHTNLGKLAVGDLVNIEVDMIAKYIEKLAL